MYSFITILFLTSFLVCFILLYFSFPSSKSERMASSQDSYRSAGNHLIKYNCLTISIFRMCMLKFISWMEASFWRTMLLLMGKAAEQQLAKLRKATCNWVLTVIFHFFVVVVVANSSWIRLSKESESSEEWEITNNTIIKIGSTSSYNCRFEKTIEKDFVNDACLICYSQDKDAVFLPCRHNTTCIKCSKTL